jgi:hypothetical protein
MSEKRTEDPAPDALPQAHPIHPEYGPCDGFVGEGECSECVKVVRGITAERDALRHERERQSAEIARLRAVLELIAKDYKWAKTQPDRDGELAELGMSAGIAAREALSRENK